MWRTETVIKNTVTATKIVTVKALSKAIERRDFTAIFVV